MEKMIRELSGTAIISGDRHISVLEMRRRVSQMAAQCNHGKGERTLIVSENREGWIYSLYAVWVNEGIVVPDESIYFNDQQEAGVYIQDGNILRFKRIQVLHHNEAERYSVCEIKDDKNYVQLYDLIVTEGEDLYDGKLVR